MADNDNQRARLVELLWQVKQTFLKEGGQNVHFRKLLNDPDYRAEILNRAANSDSEELRGIAEEAQAVNMFGSLAAVGDSTTQLDQPARGARRGDVAAPAEAGMAGVDDSSTTALRRPAAAAKRKKAGASGNVGVILGVVAGVIVLGVLAGYFLAGSSAVTVSESITEDTTWVADKTYTLTGIIFVEAGAQLNIEAGTTILGEPGSALIVTRDSALYARGEAGAPIVFTSARPVGERARGDWGGIVLLGDAPINRPTARIEGIATDDPRGVFGGSDPNANCGLLNYVRIEFAGFEISRDNELNGLTLGGCGYGTIISHVQVHKGSDDGVEFFGGTANASHVVVTGAADDQFDWDMGWQGNVQFLVIQQHPDEGDNGFEADNWSAQNDALPRSKPTMSNVTMIGSRRATRAQRGMTLRRGTGGDFRNFIMTGFTAEAIDIRDEATVALTETGELSFNSFIIHLIGRTGVNYFSTERGDGDDDGGFIEEDYFRSDRVSDIRFGEDPLLPSAVFDARNPNFIPSERSPAARGAAPVPQGEFWDEGANFLGAVRPGSRSTWLDGWTAFPEN